MPKSGFDFPKRPLFPLDSSGTATRSNGASSTLYNRTLTGSSLKNGTTSSSKRMFVYASRGIRVIQLNWKIFTSALAVTLLAIIWYYPVFFLFLLFVIYSLLLVVAGKSKNSFFSFAHFCKCNYVCPSYNFLIYAHFGKIFYQNAIYKNF